MRRLILVILLLSAAPVWADAQVERLFERVKAINPGLIDYAASIDIRFQVKMGIIPYSPKANGQYYHKKPDRHKLKLDDAPAYLKKYPKIFGWNLPDLNKYRSIVQDVKTYKGRKVYYVVLLPKGKQGDITRQELLIDTKLHTVPLHTTYYEDNGSLRVEVDYTTEKGYRVFDKMRAQFSFPKASVRASAQANYSHYRFNQGLEDSFFQDSPD